MNPDNLNEAFQAKLKQLLLRNRRLATAYRLKEELRLIFKLNPVEVSAALDKWRRRAWSCRINQYVELQRKIKRHKDEIIATIMPASLTHESKPQITKSSFPSEWLTASAISIT